MAVAVKTSPGARSSGTSGGLVVFSFVGVVYLLATIALVFKGLPEVWWRMWEAAGGVQGTLVGGGILAILELCAVVALLWGGARLLGKSSTPGVRAGVFVGFAGLIGVLLLTRWVGRWFEDSVYSSHNMEPQTGAIWTGVIGGAMLALWVFAFTRPWMQRQLVRLEEGGWFHATIYKGNQGRLVRRGTIIGILLLVAAGVYSLWHGGTLRRGPTDWVLTVPFTGRVAVERMGDAREYVRDPELVPASAKKGVLIKWPGDEKETKVGVDKEITAEQFRALVNAALDRAIAQARQKHAKANDEESEHWQREMDSLDTVKKELEDVYANKDVTDYLLAVNRAVFAEFEVIVPRVDASEAEKAWKTAEAKVQERKKAEEAEKDAEKKKPLTRAREEAEAEAKEAGKTYEDARRAVFHADIRRRLYEVWRLTPCDDPTKLLEAVKKEAETANKTGELGWVLSVPTGVPVIDRAALERANANTDKNVNVKVGLKQGLALTNFHLKEGEVVSAKAFDKEETRVYLEEAKKELDEGISQHKKILDDLATAANGKSFNEKLGGLISEEANDTLRAKLKKIQNTIAKADDVGERGVPQLVPRRETLSRATGPVLYEKVPLLPTVQLSLPLVLLALGVWFAWRTVNLPMFADFLIATEAEMNKVSWTTQKRLVQDTIVVLVTVVMMAVFLFGMDVLWKKVLSWEHIGVLHIPDSKDDTKKSITEKKW